MSLKLNLDLYKKIYLIRSSEEAIVENYASDLMKTPMHMSMGEEAIVVGICHALSNRDKVLGTYRSHALYLAKTGETDKFFAEMYGRSTGVVGGKGGSMHLSSPNDGLLATSAVVASTIPVALGIAYANKFLSKRSIVAAFFGEGACDEGEFWESLNLASLMKLPVLFVCEDNGYAVHTPGVQRNGYKSIVDIVSKFNCDVYGTNTTDVFEIYKQAKKIIRAVKNKRRPVFWRLKYYRYLEHVGVYEDFDKGYRSRSEFEKWRKIDPVDIQKKKLLKLGMTGENLDKIEGKIDDGVLKSIELANKARFPKKDELLKDVFYE